MCVPPAVGAQTAQSSNESIQHHHHLLSLHANLYYIIYVYLLDSCCGCERQITVAARRQLSRARMSKCNFAEFSLPCSPFNVCALHYAQMLLFRKFSLKFLKVFFFLLLHAIKRIEGSSIMYFEIFFFFADFQINCFIYICCFFFLIVLIINLYR